MNTLEKYRGSLHAYTVGFLGSLFITVDMYLLVTKAVLHGAIQTVVIVSLAIVQLVVQLAFFLHLSRKSGAKWNLFAVGFGSIIILIIVIGSLWIMHNLDYRMGHDTHGTGQSIIKDEGF